MRKEKISGYNSENGGSKNSHPTRKQKAILEAIRVALGKSYHPATSKQAWECIKIYKHRIDLIYYTNNPYEIPTICIDGKVVYKKGKYYKPETKTNLKCANLNFKKVDDTEF